MTGGEDPRRAGEDTLAAAVIAASDAAIVSTDLDGRVLLWNSGAEALYGYSAAEMLGQPVQRLDPDPGSKDVADLLRRVVQGEHVNYHQAFRRRADGSDIAVSLTINPIRHPDGHIVGVVSVARDIVARLRYQEELRYLAEHDPLTGAANLRRFTAEVRGQIQRARRHGECAAVLLVDLDAFKQVNDTHGHAAGDRVLTAVAGALDARLRETDLVARIGGDEFAILLPHTTGCEARALAGQLRATVEGLHVTTAADRTLSVRASIGVGTIDATTPGEDAVLAEADRAMYDDKIASAPGPRHR